MQCQAEIGRNKEGEGGTKRGVREGDGRAQEHREWKDREKRQNES